MAKEAAFKLALQLSETREKLNKFATQETLSAEEEQEMRSLSDSFGTLEARWRAATIAEQAQQSTLDGEATEVKQLEGRVKAGTYVRAAMEERSIDGAEREYNEALHIPHNHFPLALLAGPELEERATTDTNIATNPNGWLDRLLAATAATRLGISMRSVSPGEASYPLTTAGATGAQRGRTQDAATAAWTVGVKELKPTRNTVHLEFSMEDAYRIPGLEGALRRDLQAGLMESVDKAIFTGDTGANENTADIAGLTTLAGVVEKTVTQANKVKPAETLTAFVDLVDGIHAEGVGDLRTVAAVGANKLWLTTIANSAASNETIAQFLRASGLNWTTRGSIETNTANGDWGAFIGRGRGIDGAGVAAVWSSGELIRDRETKAKSGEILLTLAYYWNFGLVRASNFARVKFVT